MLFEPYKFPIENVENALDKTGDTMTGALRVDDTVYTNYVAVKEIRAYDGKFNIKFTSAAAFTITYKTGESQEATTSGTISSVYQSDKYHVMVYESGHVDMPPIAERAVSSVSDVTIDYGSPQMSVIIRIYRNGYSELSTEHLLADVVEDGKGNVLSEKVDKKGDTMSGALRVDDTDYASPIVTQSFTTYDGKFTMSFSASGDYSISYKDSDSSYSGITDTIGLANRASRYHVMVYNSAGTTLLTEREMSNVSQKAVTFDAGSGSTSVIVKVYKYGYSEMNTEHILANVVEDGGGNVLSEKLETSAFKRIRRKVTASNWSVSPDANGFYTYTLNTYQNFHNEPTPKVYGSGANDTTLPTDAQAKAYEQILFPNGYVEHYSVDTFKLYAKRKPTADFYVVIEGIYWQ